MDRILFLINLKILSSVSVLVALTGLFQIRLAVKPQRSTPNAQPTEKRPVAAIDYRYLKGGMLLIIIAALAQYFILLFHFTSE